MAADTRRWAVDPPGPPREVPPPGRWERLLTGRALGWAVVGLLAGGFLIGLVTVLIDRS